MYECLSMEIIYFYYETSVFDLFQYCTDAIIESLIENDKW